MTGKFVKEIINVGGLWLYLKLPCLCDTALQHITKAMFCGYAANFF
jgi:hypothetical protein